MEAPIAKRPAKKTELKEWLQSENFRRELATILPRQMSAERFVRIAFQATYRVPELLSCTQESFFNCLLQLGALGLEPDGRVAHLIPFRSRDRGSLECTLIIDYKGIAQLLRRNHDVATIHCDVVYTADEYEAEQGTNQHLRHIKAKGERGTPLLAYSFVRLPDGSQEFEEMSFKEIEAIRIRSRSPHKGPWVTDWPEMAKKTVFRKHSKTLPLSPETRDALERPGDGDSLGDLPLAQSVEGARSGGRPPKLAQAEPDRDSETGPETPASDSGAFSGASGGNDPAGGSNAPGKPLSPAEAVEARLEQSGYSVAELIGVLQKVKLIEAGLESLKAVPVRVLEMVLDEWDNALTRLKEARAEPGGQK